MEQGIITEGAVLKGLFGDGVFGNAQVKQTTLIEQARQNRSLGAIRNTGILTSSRSVDSASIKSNTFFGE